MQQTLVVGCGGKAVREFDATDGSSDGGNASLPDASGGSDAGRTGGATSLGGAASSGGAGSGGLIGAGGGLGGETACAPGARFATGIVEHAFGSGQSHNQEEGFPEAIFGPPDAYNLQSIVSLGNGGSVVLEFEGTSIVDGPGVDFVVFENPLANFVELATVAVSDDLITWFEFPCSALSNASNYGSCAGVQPVHSTPENGLDPLEPTTAGGDWFDLLDIQVERARYVRITDRADLTGPNGVFDLDAVGIRHAGCE